LTPHGSPNSPNEHSSLEIHDAHVNFYDFSATVRLVARSGTLEIRILCSEPDWQLSSIEQVCNSFLHPLSTVEDLSIEHHRYSRRIRKHDAIENILWSQLLLPFIALKKTLPFQGNCAGCRGHPARACSFRGRITEVLPSLRDIFVAGLNDQAIGTFLGKHCAVRCRRATAVQSPCRHFCLAQDSNMKSM
jgi:hypothetical protein